MRLPRPGFTVRWLMVAVAIAGVLLGIERFRRLSNEYESRAHWHAYHEASNCEEYSSCLYSTNDSNCWIDLSIEELKARDGVLFKPPDRLAIYHHRMQHKWRRAARYPWLPVEPDPPEPK
jgi:hypothetical protein